LGSQVFFVWKVRMTTDTLIGRVYRMNWLFRGFSLFFLAFSCFGLSAYASGIMKGESEADGVKILTACVLLLAGLGMTTHAFLSRLAFSSEGVEQISFLGRKNLPFASIRGRREYVVRGGNPGGSTRYLRVEANDDHPALEFGKKLYAFDDAFWTWFNALPDLDERDRQIHKDSSFGLV
jgi:hypothetical protein